MLNMSKQHFFPVNMSDSGTDSEQSKTTSLKFVLFFGVTACAINIAALILGVVTMNTIQKATDHQSSENSEKPVGTIACVICEDENLYPVVKKLTREKELCCAHNTDQMTSLLELTLSKPTNRQESSDHEPAVVSTNFSLSKASAHKSLLPPNETIFDSSKHTVPIFTQTSLRLNPVNFEEQEHVREVEVIKSGYGYRIKLPGLYHVYSNIKFKPDSYKSCGDFAFQVWEQLVLRRPFQKESVNLLKSVHTCGKSTTRDQESSYTSGTFYLEKDDELWVNISGLGLAYFSVTSSYFGLAMLGEK